MTIEQYPHIPPTAEDPAQTVTLHPNSQGIGSGSSTSFADTVFSVLNSNTISTVLANGQTLGFNSISFTLNTSIAGVVSFQVSRDGVTWVNVQYHLVASSTVVNFSRIVSSLNTFVGVFQYVIPVAGYERYRIIQNAAGSISAPINAIRLANLLGTDFVNGIFPGTGSQLLGKLTNASTTTNDVGVSTMYIRRDGTIPVTVGGATNAYATPSITNQGMTIVAPHVESRKLFSAATTSQVAMNSAPVIATTNTGVNLINRANTGCVMLFRGASTRCIIHRISFDAGMALPSASTVQLILSRYVYNVNPTLTDGSISPNATLIGTIAATGALFENTTAVGVRHSTTAGLLANTIIATKTWRASAAQSIFDVSYEFTYPIELNNPQSFVALFLNGLTIDSKSTTVVWSED